METNTITNDILKRVKQTTSVFTGCDESKVSIKFWYENDRGTNYKVKSGRKNVGKIEMDEYGMEYILDIKIYNYETTLYIKEKSIVICVGNHRYDSTADGYQGKRNRPSAKVTESFLKEIMDNDREAEQFIINQNILFMDAEKEITEKNYTPRILKIKRIKFNIVNNIGY